MSNTGEEKQRCVRSVTSVYTTILQYELMIFWLISTCEGSRPRWNETFVFIISDDSGVVCTRLKIKIMDKDTFSKDDFVGEATWAYMITKIINFIKNNLFPSWYYGIRAFDWQWDSVLHRISLEAVFAKETIPPISYDVIKNENKCGEIQVGLNFTQQVPHIYDWVFQGLVD